MNSGDRNNLLLGANQFPYSLIFSDVPNLFFLQPTPFILQFLPRTFAFSSYPSELSNSCPWSISETYIFCVSLTRECNICRFHTRHPHLAVPEQFKSVPFKLNPSFLASQPLSSLRTLIILLSTTNSSLVLQDIFFSTLNIQSLDFYILPFWHVYLFLPFYLHFSPPTYYLQCFIILLQNVYRILKRFLPTPVQTLFNLFFSMHLEKKFSKMENIIMPFSCLKSFNTPISYSGKKNQTH